ncbi:MAG: 2-oxoacid:acceptor oxidoreductase family protein [Eubacteriales bacterium]|nr:2-oxoacid:acceptor oxidoreductase family protein [Eubacteriales bacterium]
MLELRFHGRGGQGVVVGSTILGKAFFYDGNNAQFFPEFGVERRGAPVQAFLRVSDEKIRCRYNIYEPDHIILFDMLLLSTVDVTQGLKDNGWILINSKKPPEEFSLNRNYRVATIDADGISLKHGLGTEAAPIINAAMTGAFARIIGSISEESLVRAVRESVPARLDQNEAAAREAFNGVKILGMGSDCIGRDCTGRDCTENENRVQIRKRIAVAGRNIGQHAI